MRKLNFFIFTFSAAFLLSICSAQLYAQNLPVFKKSNDNATEKGKFLPAVSPWQPSYSVTSASIFSEKFEVATNNWQLHGSNWKMTNGKAEAVNYDNNAASYLISPVISVPAGKFKLKYSEKYALETDHDFGSVWISKDNGRRWQKVHTITGTTDWRDTYIDLTAFQNKQIKLAFVLQSDESVSGFGWQIDNLEVVKMGSNSSFRSSTNARMLQTTQSYTATLSNLNSQRFPFIFANVRISGTNQILDPSCFAVYENGTLQTDFLEISAPTTTAGLADIVFIQDNSGSTSPYQNRIINSVTDFVNALQAANIDAALGLTRFGQFANGGNPIIEEGGNLFTDLQFFLNNIYSRNTDDGGFEPGFTATVASASQFAFRPGAQRIFILITDEPSNNDTNTQQEALTALQQNSITFNAVIEPFSSIQQNHYGTLANQTAGGIYDITSPDFTPILNDISNIIAGSYAIRYKSSNPVADGTTRNVEIQIGCGGTVEAVVNGSYIPGAAPMIELTDNTKDKLNLGQALGAGILIEAEITDDVAPDVQTATLYYKNTNETNYQSVAMTKQGASDIWEGEIPGTVANPPGVDFYLTASDGNITTSLPSDDPISNPFQIAVLPNVPPVIDFTVIEYLCAGQDLDASLTITDNTNQLDRAALYYRGIGELVYTEVALNNLGGDNYGITIQAGDIPSEGVEYYIEAEDDFGVQTQEGTPDNPLVAQVTEITSITAGAQTACDVTDNTFTQEIIVEYVNPPAGKDLVVNGELFPVTASPQTVVLTLPSNGNAIDVSVSFDGMCEVTEEGLFTAPVSCTTTEPVPSSLEVQPEMITVEINDEVCIIATVLDQFGDPYEDAEVFVEIAGTVEASMMTDENGQIEYCFTPTNAGTVNVDFYYTGGQVVTAKVNVGSQGNQPPVVNAGNDRTVTLPKDYIVLNGIGYDPDGRFTAFLWEKVSGPTVTMVQQHTANVILQDLQEGVYVFRFNGTDNGGATSSDEMTLTVLQPGQIPLVSAGKDRTIFLPKDYVVLDGVCYAPSDGFTDLQWTKVSGPSVTMSNADTEDLMLTDLVMGTYVFQISCTDNMGTVHTDEMTLVVKNNEPPVVDAGTDRTIMLPVNYIVVTGIGNDPDGRFTSFEWIKLSGPSVTMNQAHTANLILSDLVEGVYVFQFSGTDNKGATATDEVEITVVATTTARMKNDVNVSAYPNTFQNYVNLKIEATESEPFAVEVYDMTGKTYYRRNLVPDPLYGLEHQIDLSDSNIKSGLYLIRVVNLNKNSHKIIKVIKARR